MGVMALFEAELLTMEVGDPKVRDLTTGYLGSDIPDAASEYANVGDSNGQVNGAILKALFGNFCSGISEDDELLCEFYKDDQVVCISYNPRSGNLYGAVVNSPTSSSSIEIRKHGDAIFAALMAYSEFVQGNSEYKATKASFLAQWNAGFTDKEESLRNAARLCENIRKRILKSSELGRTALPILNLGSRDMEKIRFHEIKAMHVKSVFQNSMTFKVFGSSGIAVSKVKTLEMLQDKYSLKRSLTAEEEKLIPVMSKDYVMPTEVPLLCEHIIRSGQIGQPMRNFLLRGPSGTGKTEMAKAVAYGLRIPYVFYTCSSSDEIYNFVGQFLPAVVDQETGANTSFTSVLQSGGFNRFLQEKSLPTCEDIDLNTTIAYKKLTGQVKEDVTEVECVILLLCKLMALISADQSSGSQRFTYTDTDFIKAIRNGYLCEIQECGVILQPGVLVGLNGLLDQTARVRLMTGELVQRHPDTVIIMTTNVAYEGCRPINQALLSRMSLIIDTPELTDEQMIERVTKATGFSQAELLQDMCKVVHKVQEYCFNTGMNNGVCGYRELLSWVVSYMITGDLNGSLENTILSHAANDIVSRVELQSNCVAQYLPAAA